MPMDDPVLSTTFAVSLFILILAFFFMLRATQQKRYILQKLKLSPAPATKEHASIREAVKHAAVKKAKKRKIKRKKR